MNTTILSALALVLFDVLGLLDHYETVVVNMLCFMFGFSFGHYVANVEKIRTLSNIFYDHLNYFIQCYNKNNNVNLYK